MKIKTILLVGLAVLFCRSFGFTQDTIPSSPLSWAECVSIASRNNPALAAAWHALETSKATYSGSYNSIYPNLSLSHTYSNSENTNGVGNTIVWQTEGSVNWNIFNMSQINTIKISQAQEIQAEATLRQASASLRYSLSAAFYQVLYDQENIEVSKNVLEMRDKSSQLVTLRYESGTGYKGDMLTAKAELFSAKADLAQANRSLRADQRVLNQQLGFDEFTVISVTSTFTVHNPGDLPKDFESLLAKRPDIIAQYAILKIAQLNLDQAKSSLWPILSASYLLYNSGPNEFQEPHSGWGLGLSYPIFGGGPTATYYAITAAKSSLEQATQNMRTIREQALSNIEAAWSNFEGAIDQTKVQAAMLESARVRNDEADIRYSSGLMTYDNWEIIASARISQEHTAIQSQLTALNAEAAWAQSLGKQLEEQ